jgi:hypothetical protein
MDYPLIFIGISWLFLFASLPSSFPELFGDGHSKKVGVWALMGAIFFFVLFVFSLFLG